MEAVLDMSNPQTLTVGATGVERIMQRLQVILSTIKGTVPLDREFGVASTAVDLPLPEAMGAHAADAVAAVDAYEPAVEILQVTYKESISGAQDGALYPVVRFKIKEEYLESA